jgi:acyl carrier protein
MEEKILQILKDVQSDFAFEDGVDFIEEGYLDSFDIVTLVSDLENEFNILISALAIVPENFGSVRAIAALVAKSEKREF